MKEKIERIPLLGTLILFLVRKVRRIRKVLRRYSLFLKNKPIFNKNIALKNRFKGKRAFILACGPSIKTQDLSGLAGEFCISVSNFFVHKDFNTIKPEYHVFAESHTPITDEQMVAWLQDAEKHFQEDQKVVMAIMDKPLVDQNNLLKKNPRYYYTLTESKSPLIKEVDFTKPIPRIQTVAHQAIYLALYSGATEIYLIGCDHDTILHLGESRHFYEEGKNAMMQKGLSEWTHPNWLAHFKSYTTLWEIYQRIDSYAKRTGVKIYNATPGSLLDVFPTKDLSGILISDKTDWVQKRQEQ